MELTGIVQNGVVVFDNGVPWPEGTRVKIALANLEEAPRTAKELLMQFAGCMTDLPSDLARNHDHYLHGTPKK